MSGIEIFLTVTALVVLFIGVGLMFEEVKSIRKQLSIIQKNDISSSRVKSPFVKKQTLISGTQIFPEWARYKYNYFTIQEVIKALVDEVGLEFTPESTVTKEASIKKKIVKRGARKKKATKSR